MKKSLVLLLFALLANICVCQAQDNTRQRRNGGPRMDPKMRTEQMIKVLELNEQQAAQFRVVMEEQQKQMMAMFQEGEPPSQEKMMEQAQAINVVLQMILTEDQFKKYQELNSRRGMNRMSGEGQRGNGEGRRGFGEGRRTRGEGNGEG